MKLATGRCVFLHEFKLISKIPDMVLETPMYALLAQLLDIPNYQVVSAEIGTDKNTLDIEGISIAFPIRSRDRYLRQRHALAVAKPQEHCTKDTPASFAISLSVASRLISALSDIDSSVKTYGFL